MSMRIINVESNVTGEKLATIELYANSVQWEAKPVHDPMDVLSALSDDALESAIDEAEVLDRGFILKLS